MYPVDHFLCSKSLISPFIETNNCFLNQISLRIYTLPWQHIHTICQIIHLIRICKIMLREICNCLKYLITRTSVISEIVSVHAFRNECGSCQIHLLICFFHEKIQFQIQQSGTSHQEVTQYHLYQS